MITFLMIVGFIVSMAMLACHLEDREDRKKAEQEEDEKRRERARQFGAKIGRELRKIISQ